jgi:glutamine amidotransferase
MIGIVDAGLGNIGSVSSMLTKLKIEHRLVQDASGLDAATGLILPGVGAFDTGMAALGERGLIEPLRQLVAGGTPLLGICLGMQLLCRRSDEGASTGLCLIEADVVRFDGAAVPGRRVPHMGWNVVTVRRTDSVLPQDPDQRFYFVHSFHVVCDDTTDVVGTTFYGESVTAAVQRGVVAGVQFHPEKSHRFGMAVLRRYADDLVANP